MTARERIATVRPGNVDYALVSVRGMADIESDRLELALENLFLRHCSGKSALKSKEYCGEFCKVCYDTSCYSENIRSVFVSCNLNLAFMACYQTSLSRSCLVTARRNTKHFVEEAPNIVIPPLGGYVICHV